MMSGYYGCLLFVAVWTIATGIEDLPDAATLSRILDAADAASSAVTCAQAAPGVNKLRHGYGVAYLDVLPYNVGGNDGQRRAVIDYTCDQGKKWNNPYNTITYDLPDQIASVTTVPRGILTFDSHLWKSYNEVKETYSTNIGLDILMGIFGFSYTKERLRHSLHAQRKYVEDVQSFVSGSKAEYIPPWQLTLNNGALEFINRFLGDTYEESPDAYDGFVDFYGTHYYGAAQFGGILKMTMETEKELVAEQGDDSTKFNAEAAYHNWIGLNGAHSNQDKNVDGNFTARTSTTQRYYGGQGALGTPDFYTKWVASVPSDPWLFSGEMAPLSILFPNGTKGQAMETATRVSLNKAMLNELRTTLVSIDENINSLPENGTWRVCDGHFEDKQCFRSGIGGVWVYGCSQANWANRAYVLDSWARRLIFDIDEMLNTTKGRNTTAVESMVSRANIILRIMDTTAPILSKTVTTEHEICHCESASGCRATGPNIMASVKAPQPFWSRWEYGPRPYSKTDGTNDG